MNKKQIKEVLEKLDWCMYEDDCGGADLRKVSPAGEDFGFFVNLDNFVEEVNEYVLNFDTEEHIEMWVQAKMEGVSGVPSVRELVKDADDIKEMLEELLDSLREVEND